MPAPGNTTARGYGADHQRRRRAALAALVPGTPCGRCGQPMHPGQHLDLDHTDDRDGYRGLAHSRCNRSAGGKKGSAGRRRTTTYTSPRW